MYDGTRSALFSNCTTGNASDLPDRNLDALIATDYPSGNIISVLIDGTHDNPEEDHETDACETDWSNMRLGQHRQTNIVVQSNCDAPNRFSNVATGGGDNGIDLEVDAGGVSMVNAEGNTGSLLLKADKVYLYANEDGTLTQLDPSPANLSISNNRLPNATLIMANADAAASTVGCGNTFVAPTPYLCAPSSFTQLPGGRLTLVQGQPVMTADTTATTVYYAPYLSQQVPIYNPSAGVFGLSDVTPDGLVLRLDTAPSASTLYDIFAELDGNDAELCAGPAWSNSGAGSSARASDISQVSGVWVNNTAISCAYHHGSMSGPHACGPLECTYLGTLRTTSAGGEVAQQFSPTPNSGGTAPCLCLYNAYNHVNITSSSVDSGSSYGYGSASWELMRASAGNGVTVVDGLGQMQIAALLTDKLANFSTTKTANIALALNPPSGGIPAPLTPIAQAGSTTPASYTVTFSHTPIQGLWIAQAIEAALGAGSNAALFGGNGYQQLSVQVAD